MQWNGSAGMSARATNLHELPQVGLPLVRRDATAEQRRRSRVSAQQEERLERHRRPAEPAALDVAARSSAQQALWTLIHLHVCRPSKGRLGESRRLGQEHKIKKPARVRVRSSLELPPSVPHQSLG